LQAFVHRDGRGTDIIDLVFLAADNAATAAR
jgi:hypothetical protein